MGNESTWTERRARLVELQKNYPIFKDILKINRLINTFTFLQRSDEKHEENFVWLENKLKEMSK